MQTNLSELKNNVIYVDEQNIKLKKFDSSVLTYEIAYRIDPVTALKFGAAKVMIYASFDTPSTMFQSRLFSTTEQNSGVSGINPTSLIQGILTRNSQIKEAIRTKDRNSYFVEQPSDFLSKTNNNVLSVLPDILTATSTVSLQKKRTFNAYKISDLQKTQNSNPVQMDTPVDVIQPPFEQLDNYSVVAKRMLYDGIDPANCAKKQITTAADAHSGLVSVKTLKTQFDMMDDLELLTKSILGDQKRQNIAPSSYISQPKTQNFSTVEVKEEINIPFSIVGKQDFWFIVDLVDENNISLQSRVVFSQNSKYIEINSLIKSVPTFDVMSNSDGTCLLTINAKGLAKVVVYKKYYTHQRSYRLVGEYDVNASGMVELKDNNPKNSFILYRVLGVTTDEKTLPGFSSKVIQTNGKLCLRSIEPTIFASTSSNGVLLEVSNIPTDVISVQIYKKKIGTTQNYSLVGTPFFTQSKSETYTVTDVAVSDQSVYEYVIEVSRKNGLVERLSRTKTIVRYIATTTSLFSTQLNNSKVVQTGNDLDVSFLITTTIQETQQALLKQRLDSAGLGIYYQDFIDPEDLGKIFVYKIIRFNITENVIEDLGFTATPEFSDLNQSKSNNASTVKLGCEYRYVVQTFLRQPDTMLPTFQVDKTADNGQSYSYKPYEWQTPSTLRSGTFTLNGSYSSLFSQSEFEIGELAVESTITVSTTQNLASIFNQKATKLLPNVVKLSWSINGSNQDIEHFIVVENIAGLRQVVGKVHSFAQNSSFSYVHELKNREVGTIVYSIIPVYMTYNLGKEVLTNSVLIEDAEI